MADKDQLLKHLLGAPFSPIIPAMPAPEPAPRRQQPETDQENKNAGEEHAVPSSSSKSAPGRISEQGNTNDKVVPAPKLDTELATRKTPFVRVSQSISGLNIRSIKNAKSLSEKSMKN